MRRAFLIVLIAAFALTGCASTAAPHATNAPHATKLSNGARESSTSPPHRTLTPTPTMAPATNQKLATPTSEAVGAYLVQIPVDNGPRQYAMGTVTLDSKGVPVAYHVAPGDIIDYVSERFGFDVATGGAGINYLNTINQVRRGTYQGASDDYFALYAGDTLNLSAYTIKTVGNSNGRVYSGPMPTPAPPQH